MRNRIAEWRTERGLTQEELAERVGSHYTTINRLENGKQGLSEKWITKLATVLEVHPSDLLAHGGDPKPPPPMSVNEEAEPYEPEPGHWTVNAKLGEHQFFYKIRSDALDAIGISNGAVIVADFSADAVAKAHEPEERAVPALVQYHYDPQDFMKCLTLPRQFVPPFLAIRNSRDKRAEPIVIGDGKADVIAICVGVIRDT